MSRERKAVRVDSWAAVEHHLKAELEREGGAIRHLAEKAGLNGNAASRWLGNGRDKRTPTAEVLLKLAGAAGYDVVLAPKERKRGRG